MTPNIGQVQSAAEAFPSPALLRAWAATSHPAFLRRSSGFALAALALGIVSGAAVRLTGSGLGCSDWPSCTATSVVAPLQFHAWVEFGNRLVNVLITLGVVTMALSGFRRRPRRRDLAVLASTTVAGILGEVVLGGETVLHKLAPGWVMAHFLLGIALLMAAALLYHRSGQPDQLVARADGRTSTRVGQAFPLVRPAQVMAVRVMLVWSVVAVCLGAVVTSTGPHAGAPGVPRFRFSLHSVAQLHGTAVELLLALTVGTLWSLQRSRAPRQVLRNAEVLLAVLAAQGAIGYTQYFTGDPVLLVAVHVTGAVLVVLAMLSLNLSLYTRQGTSTGQTVRTGSEPWAASLRRP